MKYGYTPNGAARLAIDAIVEFYPDFSGAIVVVDKYGHHGAACHGFNKFPYSIANSELNKVSVLFTDCT